MTVLSVQETKDEHGADHSIVTMLCSAASLNGCTSTVTTEDVDGLSRWATLLGFMDETHEGGNDHFCSVPCLKLWAEKLT